MSKSKTVKVEENDNFKKAEERHKYHSKDGRYTYHIAIIDYLVNYHAGKKSENWFKVNILRKDPEGISAVPPGFYSRRF